MEYLFFSLLRAFGGFVIFLYWGVTIFIFWKIARSRMHWGVRLLAGVLVAAPLLGWPLSEEIRHRQAVSAAKQRYATAKARFDEHCKSAGVKIYRTAEDVEGVFLMKLRPKMNFNENPQFQMNDPYGYDYEYVYDGEAYAQSFMWSRKANGELVATLDGPGVVSNGYHYIELINPKTNKRMRYEARMLAQSEGDYRHKWEKWGEAPCGEPASASEHYRSFMNCPVPIIAPDPRYGVTFDDISTREDREYWIAGSSLRVIDLQTNEVMAERIGYMMDPLQGNRIQGSQPWWYAKKNGFVCPDFLGFPSGKPGSQSGQTRNFVEQVLKPKQVH